VRAFLIRSRMSLEPESSPLIAFRCKVLGLSFNSGAADGALDGVNLRATLPTENEKYILIDVQQSAS
jgi:hypothetical protein